jgi:hypothetical protein
MTCVILQDGSGSAEDQPHAVEHPFGSGEDLSGRETEFVEDPSPEVQRRQRWTMKSNYIAPPPVPTNQKSRPIIKPVSER